MMCQPAAVLRALHSDFRGMTRGKLVGADDPLYAALFYIQDAMAGGSQQDSILLKHEAGGGGGVSEC